MRWPLVCDHAEPLEAGAQGLVLESEVESPDTPSLTTNGGRGGRGRKRKREREG